MEVRQSAPASWGPRDMEASRGAGVHIQGSPGASAGSVGGGKGLCSEARSCVLGQWAGRPLLSDLSQLSLALLFSPPGAGRPHPLVPHALSTLSLGRVPGGSQGEEEAAVY